MIQSARTDRFKSHNSPLCDLDAGGAGLLGASRIIFVVVLALLPGSGYALDRQDAQTIPHVNQKAKESFIEYLYADQHKAYAIAPGGAWAWSAQQLSRQAAQSEALKNCQSHTQQQCVLYAVNDQRVFNKEKWPRLWRLDKRFQSTTRAKGIARGAVFPNLLIKDRHGKAIQLHDVKAKLRLVHFWGSWCPPCMREMPSLVELQKTLAQRYGKQIKLVLLQVREPFSQSLKWARQQGFARLPLYDSGIKNDQDSQLRTTRGKAITDRTLARAFPTSYVLDAKGRVLFAHTGPIYDWLEYLPFFNDIIKQGKT